VKIYIAYCVNDTEGKLMHAAFTKQEYADRFISSLDETEKREWPYSGVCCVELADDPYFLFDNINRNLRVKDPHGVRCEAADGIYRSHFEIDDVPVDIVGTSIYDVKRQMQELYTDLYSVKGLQEWANAHIKRRK